MPTYRHMWGKISKRKGKISQGMVTSGIFTPWPNRPWPPLWPKKIFFTYLKNWKTWFGPPLCVSTSGQRTFAPPSLFKILNTPLMVTSWLELKIDSKMMLRCSVNSSYLLGGGFSPLESQIPPENHPNTKKHKIHPPDMWSPQNTESRIHTG